MGVRMSINMQLVSNEESQSQRQKQEHLRNISLHLHYASIVLSI